MCGKLIIALALLAVLSWNIYHAQLTQRLMFPYPYKETVETYAAQYGLDPLLGIAVMREESRFRPRTESRQGATGLMQLMPETARWIAGQMKDADYSEEHMFSPEKNIQYGMWYLKDLNTEFQGNIILVLAAYNGGRGHVREWLNNQQIDADNTRIQDIPFRETREYVGKVLRSYAKYRDLY
jgi:soluble lytic murein transglycosylase